MLCDFVFFQNPCAHIHTCAWGFLDELRDDSIPCAKYGTAPPLGIFELNSSCKSRFAMTGLHAHDEYDIWRSDQLLNVGLDCIDYLLPNAVFQDMVPPSIHTESDYSYVIDALEANVYTATLYNRFSAAATTVGCGYYRERFVMVVV